jgi:hypothetical protein
MICYKNVSPDGHTKNTIIYLVIDNIPIVENFLKHILNTNLEVSLGNEMQVDFKSTLKCVEVCKLLIKS